MRISIAALAASALMLGATAADADPISPYASWTGFYVGAHAGYAWGDSSSHYTDPALSTFDINMKPSGEFGGLQAGYDYQMPNNIVLGALADIALDNVSDTIPDRLAAFAGHGPNTITSRTQYSGTARLRVGYALDRFLPYVTGGYAWAHSRIAATDGSISTSADFSGWTLGAGAEYALTDHVSLKAEYLYADFSRKTVFAGQAYESSSAPSSNGLLVGVNYRF